jgi:hypothetical protein
VAKQLYKWFTEMCSEGKLMASIIEKPTYFYTNKKISNKHTEIDVELSTV